MTSIRIVAQRNPATIERLLDVWESAVRATHTFLHAADIRAIKPEAEQGLKAIAHLYCFYDAQDIIQGFIGVENQKIAMLFVGAQARGQGIGKQLLQYALNNLDAIYVDVNEQNEQGIGFYHHLGFRVISRSPQDESGRPLPILYLKLLES